MQLESLLDTRLKQGCLYPPWDLRPPIGPASSEDALVFAVTNVVNLNDPKCLPGNFQATTSPFGTVTTPAGTKEGRSLDSLVETPAPVLIKATAQSVTYQYTWKISKIRKAIEDVFGLTDDEDIDAVFDTVAVSYYADVSDQCGCVYSRSALVKR